jgi:ATP-binding cassette subfamily F protein 3
MLQLNQVSLRRGDRLLITQATFQVHPGNRLGVTGANGSGKSSLFSAILGDLEIDDGQLSLDPGYRIAHVAQESPSSERSALDYVLDGDSELRSIQALIEGSTVDEHTPEQHLAWDQLDAIDGYTADSRAARLLHGLGFANDTIHQEVNAFSGGWRMRLNLAQALMCRSDLLLLDEPTNHLDLPAILWLERWLNRYQGILLLISHDRDFLDSVCNRIAQIEHQQIGLYTGTYSQFEKVRAEQLAQQQAMYSKQQKEISHIQSYVDRFRYKASKAKQAQSRLKMLDRMTRIAPAHVDSPFHFQIPAPDRQPDHLLQLEHVSAGYDDQIILSDVNVHIGSGDRLGLLGVNGAGKSTLVKALANGSTLLTGERVIHRDTKIGYFTQHQLDLLNPQQSPLEHLREEHPQDREQELRNYLGGFGFNNDRIFDPVEPFSGGEKARLVLAMIIKKSPNLLLLDEPTNHLDLEMRLALSMALVDYEGALVVISHDRHLLRMVCDELLIVHSGMVDLFKQSLDDYPQWLAEQEQTKEGTPDAVQGIKSGSKRQQRQEQARRREILKPLSNRVREIDQQMTGLRQDLEQLETLLADQSIYQDADRKQELSELLRVQSEKRKALEQLEWDWLEASEALEVAESDIV